MSKASRTKKENRERKSTASACVYYVHTDEGYVGMLASRKQAQESDKHSVLICNEEEVAKFPAWGNEKANQFVIEKSFSLGFKRKGDSAFFERTTEGTGYVYFIEAVGLSRIKIGYSDDPEKRLRQLATGSPISLRIFARMPGNQVMEREIHARFAHLKVDNEWFHFTDDIRTYIEKNCI
jgi:hypothetical protein